MNNFPNSTKETIDQWAAGKLSSNMLGGFVRAVLENNLREAFSRADSHNRAAMFEIVYYCHNNIPSACWGSAEAVRAWK